MDSKKLIIEEYKEVKVIPLLNTIGDHLLHLDSPSFSSELQDTSSVESVEPESVPDFESLLQFDSTSISSQNTSIIEIESVSESEGLLNNANVSPTDFFLEHHDYELFLLQKRLMHHLTISNRLSGKS